MDETIDYSIVFAKTPKGVAEINARSGALTLQARRVLIMIDGRRPVAELMAVVRTGEFDGIISTLETQSMIEKVEPSSLPPRDYEQEDFADTISLLQENAAALRSQPHLTAAAIAQNPVQARPPATTPSAEPAVEASTEAAAIAARAVATASASHPGEAVRRPPTIGVPSPVTTNDMAAGTGRPATLTGTVRLPDPPRRPPTLSGARPATLSGVRPATLSGVRPVPVSEHAQAAVEAPARPAPATVRVEAAPAPAAPASAAPAPAAPTPAATTPVRTLEEEKRIAVSELYSVLGPYGEQPVAKLQECMTIDALREQIKQAGKRVATFRGEKAAQDYLRAVGCA